MTYIFVYAAVALLVLLVACLNFVHLASTISLRRAHEFSVRRAYGALRTHLSMQMLAESFLVTMLALAGSITLVQLMLPFFNSFTGRVLTLAGLLHPVVLLVLFVLVVLVILGAGVIPAVVHTLARPVALLHSSVGTSKKNRMPGQKVFILAQLTILSFLLICTFVVQHQLTFMKGQSLGFEREQRVILDVKSDLPGFHRRYEAVGESFRSIPEVLNASVSSSVPGEQWGGYNLTRTDVPEPEPVFGRVFTVDPYFSEVYGLECLEGRAFTADGSGEENYGYVINETLMRELGFTSPQDALGQQIRAHYHGMTKPIIGVIRDFHFFGMQQEINPMLLDIEPSLMSRITLTVPSNDVQASLRAVAAVWEDQFPGIPFEYRFLDEVFDAQYRYEEQAGRLLAIVTVVTILIALMGLIGLVMSIVQQRRSEIGIRKVLGATQFDIIRMLMGSMMIYAVISAGIAIPIAWWIMHLWLGNFAYRVAQTPWLPLTAVGVILLLTVGMMSLQGWRTSRINPATVIRAE